MWTPVIRRPALCARNISLQFSWDRPAEGAPLRARRIPGRPLWPNIRGAILLAVLWVMGDQICRISAYHLCF